jgi:neprilysin
MQLNGSNVDENIADNIGLQVSYRAFRDYLSSSNDTMRLPGLEQYTADQILFLSLANSYCDLDSNRTLLDSINGMNKHQPGKYRIIGSVSNSLAFSRSFKCEGTDKMNPEKKCNIWGTKG